MLIKLDQSGTRTWTGERSDLRAALPLHSNPTALSPAILADLGVYELLPDISIPAGSRINAERFQIVGTQARQIVTAYNTPEQLAAEQAAADQQAQAAAEAQQIAAYTAQMSALAPILDGHPDPADVIPGGQFYRLPDPDNAAVLTLWYVRDSDHIAQQLSSHDAAGNPINRSVNLKTRTCTTFLLGEIVGGISAAARNKAKKETSVGAAKPKKGKGK